MRERIFPQILGRLDRDPPLDQIEAVARLVGDRTLRRARERVLPTPGRRRVRRREREGVHDLRRHRHLVDAEPAAAITGEQDSLSVRKPGRVHRRAEEALEAPAVSIQVHGVNVG
jgi:hypothetical protein